MIPCKECIVYAICRSHETLKCELLSDYLNSGRNWKQPGGFTDEHKTKWKEVYDLFPLIQGVREDEEQNV